jgi:anti-sigma factor RsiW
MLRPHIQEELMDRYAMGTLPQESVADVEEHLLVCPTCQDRLTELDEFLTVFRAASTQLEPAPVQSIRRRPYIRVLWAGAAAAVVLLAVLVSREPGAVRLPPATLVVQSLRGPESGAHVAASRPFLLVFDVAATSPVAQEIEIVNAEGSEIVKPVAGAKDGWLAASIQRLPRGDYWVRVYLKQATRDLIAEYKLQVE